MDISTVLVKKRLFYPGVNGGHAALCSSYVSVYRHPEGACAEGSPMWLFACVRRSLADARDDVHFSNDHFFRNDILLKISCLQKIFLLHQTKNLIAENGFCLLPGNLVIG